jgi:hypothetical protein
MGRIHKIPTSQPDGREEPVEGGREGGAEGETVPEGGEERDSLLHGPVESLAAVGGEEEEVREGAGLGREGGRKGGREKGNGKRIGTRFAG